MRAYEIITEDNVIKFPTSAKNTSDIDKDVSDTDKDLSDLEKLKKDKRHLAVTRGDDGIDRDEEGGYTDDKFYYPDPSNTDHSWVGKVNPFPKKMMSRWSEYFDTLDWDAIVKDIKDTYDNTSPDRKDLTMGNEYKNIPFKIDGRHTGLSQRFNDEFNKRYGEDWRDYANAIYHKDMEVPFDEREMNGSFWRDRDNDWYKPDLTPLDDSQKYKNALTLTKLKNRGVEKNYKNAYVVVNSKSGILAELITNNESFINYENERMKEKSNFENNGWYYSFGITKKSGMPVLHSFDTEDSFRLLLNIVKANNLEFISIPHRKKKIKNDKFVDDEIESDDAWMSMINQED